MWLKAPVEETGREGEAAHDGRGDSTCGTPQGGVVSPLLANLYMNRFLKYWRSTGRGEAFQAQVVNYADDFVILSRGQAAEALEWTRRVMARIGLTLNEAKTDIKEARTGAVRLSWLHVRPASLSKGWPLVSGSESVSEERCRLKRKVGELLRSHNKQPWPKVAGQLNQLLRGWSAYFQLRHPLDGVSGGRQLRL